jgi:hypothetical protein
VGEMPARRGFPSARSHPMLLAPNCARVLFAEHCEKKGAQFGEDRNVLYWCDESRP